MNTSRCLIWILVVCLDISPAVPVDNPVDYSRHKVIRVFARTLEHKHVINSLTDNPKYDVDVWDESIVNGSVDLHIRPDVFDELTRSLNSSSIKYQLLIADLQSLINRERSETEEYRAGRRRRALNPTFPASQSLEAVERNLRKPVDAGIEVDDHMNLFNEIFSEHVEEGEAETEERSAHEELDSIIYNYARHTEIVEWLFAAKRFRPDIIELYEIGRSYEGRPMHVIRIGARNESKPAVWIDGGIHAREWISPATAVYIIYCLVTGYDKVPKITTLVDEFDWFILPVMNPDGYEHSHATDRMWRKTRSRSSPRRNCIGVDGNRNFDFQWLTECDGQPATTRCRGKGPCEDTYAGKQPFSEAETIAAANFILQHRDRLKMYISLHSYSQLWLTPWGYTRTHPADYDAMMKVARKAVETLESKHGTTYEIGSPAEILYAATGGSYDWAKGVAGIKYSYTIELRDKGFHGFILPRTEILPTGEETWTAIITAVAEMTNDTCWVYNIGC